MPFRLDTQISGAWISDWLDTLGQTRSMITESLNAGKRT